jgi:hypothetical protein
LFWGEWYVLELQGTVHIRRTNVHSM